MRKIIRLTLALAIVLASVLSLTACSFGDGEYKASYKKTETTYEKVSQIRDVITDSIHFDFSTSKYQSTYNYEYTNKKYEYTTKYDVLMKVNTDAGVGEVFAYMELKSFYEQADGLHGRDLDIKYCIVREGEGNYYSDYKVYMLLDGQTYNATFNEMHEKIQEQDVYLSGSMFDEEMFYALNYESTQGSYFETILGYTMAITGGDVVSTLDNPFIYCLHGLNLGEFLDTLYGLDESSSSYGYTFYTAPNAYKIKRNYSDRKYGEASEFVSYLKINADGTYAYKRDGSYKVDNAGRAFEYSNKKELKPLLETIELPAWIN